MTDGLKRLKTRHLEIGLHPPTAQRLQEELKDTRRWLRNARHDAQQATQALNEARKLLTVAHVEDIVYSLRAHRNEFADDLREAQRNVRELVADEKFLTREIAGLKKGGRA